MQGKTHNVGGIVAGLGTYIVLRENNLLPASEVVNPLLQLIMMYPAAIWGATAPDQDHGYTSIPMRDPLSYLLWFILHIPNMIYNNMDKARQRLGLRKKSVLQRFVGIFRCNHRSYQTHSDITILFLIWLVTKVVLKLDPNVPQNTLIILIGSGMLVGFLSHVFLDLCTTDGIPSIILMVLTSWLPKKLRIRKISLVFGSSFFSTDSLYEKYVRKLLNKVSYLMMTYIVLKETGLWQMGYQFLINNGIL